MAQISFKIPEEEMEFLKWYSNKRASSMSVLYKEATLKQFQKWKIQTLLKLYSKGTIGFKQFCKLGSISFQEGMLLIEENSIEPPIATTVDAYTDTVREKIIAKIKSE